MSIEQKFIQGWQNINKVKSKENKNLPHFCDVRVQVCKARFVARNCIFATRVKKTKNNHWKKLVRLMNYHHATNEKIASMSANNTQTIKWYIKLQETILVPSLHLKKVLSYPIPPNKKWMHKVLQKAKWLQ